MKPVRKLQEAEAHGKRVARMTVRKPTPPHGPGRPPILGARLRKVLFSLDDQTIERAREIGPGNASAGLRIAVAAYRPPRKRT